METNLGVEINADKVLEMFKHFSPAQAEAEWRRTLRKTGNYMKTLVGREVSKAKQIPLKVLRDRLNYYLKSPSTAKVWLGLNPIEAHRLAYGAGNDALYPPPGCTKTVRGEADGDPGVLPGLRVGGPAVFR